MRSFVVDIYMGTEDKVQIRTIVKKITKNVRTVYLLLEITLTYSLICISLSSILKEAFRHNYDIFRKNRLIHLDFLNDSLFSF